MKHLVCFSGGKDSTAMLLHMMELKYPIDEVINIDTGMEFPAMYAHIAQIRKIVEEAGIKFTVIKAEKGFEYYLLKHPYTSRDGIARTGYGWTRGRFRWCTSFLKVAPMRKHCKKYYQGERIIHYVGIAADEQYRLERQSNKYHIHPLAEWGWTEKDALEYCYSKGFYFGGLYNIFERVSCWCCPLQSLTELKKLYVNFPTLWRRLKALEAKGDVSFRPKESILMLEARFKLEKEREAKGLTTNPHTKEFREALREVYSQVPPHTISDSKINKKED